MGKYLARFEHRNNFISEVRKGFFPTPWTLGRCRGNPTQISIKNSLFLPENDCFKKINITSSQLKASHRLSIAVTSCVSLVRNQRRLFAPQKLESCLIDGETSAPYTRDHAV